MFQRLENVAIIPARIGSKRIKKKNIKFFYGKPILQWTYEIIKKSKIFNKVVLTSKGKQVKEYINVIRKTSKLLGKNYFFRTKSEFKNKIFRRSIYATKNIKKGEKFTQDNIKVIRPGYGLEPIYYEKLINKKSPISILKETSLKKNILSKLKIK